MKLNLYTKKIFLQTLYFLILKEFSIRYKGTFFGYLWTVLNPISFSIIYFMAFKIVMRFEIDNYIIVLLTAMFPWFWISTTLIQGTTSFRNNSTLLKKLNFNYITLPLSNLLHDCIHFIFSIPVILCLLFLHDFNFYLSWLWQIPTMIFVQIFFLFPLILIFSTLNVFVRDIEYIISVLLTMIFFLTPIIYTEDMIPEYLKIFFQFNPFNILISNWRSLFMDGNLNLLQLLIFIIPMFILVFFSRVYYFRKKGKFSEYL